MESRHDSENAERILYNMRPKELVRKTSYESSRCINDMDDILRHVFLQVEVIKKAYMQGEIEVEEPQEGEEGEEEHSASPRNVGHNIYILAHQVSHQLCLKSVVKLANPRAKHITVNGGWIFMALLSLDVTAIKPSSQLL